MKFRKKPVEVEAFRYRVDPAPKWFYDAAENGVVAFFKPVLRSGLPYIEIKTLEGRMRACAGDYVICGVTGELYPCKAEIFQKTYEEVREDGTIDENNGARW